MKQKLYDDMREQLLEEEYYVIDFLPRQVPAQRGKDYCAAERYLSSHPQIDSLYHSFSQILVKLSCYFDMAVYDPRSEKWSAASDPEDLVKSVMSCTEAGPDRYLHIIFPTENAMLTLEGEDLYMTVYHPGEYLQGMLKILSEGEGLFLRQPLH